MFVVTPKPASKESLMGYLLRLTEANCYPSISYVLSTLNGDRWYATAVGRLDATPLGELARLEGPEITRLTMMPEARPRAYDRVHGTDLPSYEVACSAPKVCPECLKIQNFCEAFWDLTQASACPVHGVYLVSVCPDCNRPVRWSRKKVRECRCGSEITKWAAKVASDNLRAVMELLRLRLYSGASIEPPIGLDHLAHLDIRQLCKLLWVFSNLVRDKGRNRTRSKARSGYQHELDAVADILSNWPINFRAFLKSTYLETVSTETALPPFRPTFPWLFSRLIKNVEGGRHAFRFVEREVYEFAAQHWTRAAMSRDLQDHSLFPKTFRWGTLSEAKVVLGLHMKTLRKLVESGEIPSRPLVGKPSRSISVDLTWAHTSRRSAHPDIPIREAAKVVGVSIDTMKALCTSELFQRRHRPSHPNGMTVEDVRVLAGRLQSLSKFRRLCPKTSVITLNQAFLLCGASPSEKASTYVWLVSNPRLVRGRDDRGVGMGQLQVERKKIESFFRSIRDDDEYITAKAAARKLGCADAIVTALKRSGHLDCRRIRGRLFPRKGSVATFSQQYESAARVASSVGIPVKRAYARVDFTKFRSIKVATTQYSTTFIHKDDMELALKLFEAAKAA